VAQLSERLIVCKQTMHIFRTEGFNLLKLNEVAGKQQNWPGRLTGLQLSKNINHHVQSNKFWKFMRENVTISAKNYLGCYELKKHKPWFDEGCS
jgi:hypothetical protein